MHFYAINIGCVLTALFIRRSSHEYLPPRSLFYSKLLYFPFPQRKFANNVTSQTEVTCILAGLPVDTFEAKMSVLNTQ